MPQTVERVLVQFAPASASESQFRLAGQLEVFCFVTGASYPWRVVLSLVLYFLPHFPGLKDIHSLIRNETGSSISFMT